MLAIRPAHFEKFLVGLDAKNSGIRRNGSQEIFQSITEKRRGNKKKCTGEKFGVFVTQDSRNYFFASGSRVI
jgi:hypothetical protein